MSNEEYIIELEKTVIFLCDVYTKGADSLVCQTNDANEVDDEWFKVMMSFPTIQGSLNRIYVERIGKLRTIHHNREAVKLSFKDLYEKIRVGRHDPTNIEGQK